MMIWKNVLDDGPPPYDTRVLVRGKNEYGYWLYAIAYNELYRPEMSMTQIVVANEDLPIYMGVPFKILQWMKLE